MTSTVRVAAWRAHGTVITLGVAGLVLVANETLPFGLINVMAADLGVSQGDIGLLVTGYALVIVAVSIPLAAITKRVPRRQLFAVTFVVWAAGAAVAALAADYQALLVGRLLTALAQALYWAVASATVAGLFAPEVRGRAVSRMLLGPSSAAVIGLPTLTWLGQTTDWRMPFWVLTSIGVALAVAAAVVIPSYRPDQGGAARGSHPHVRRFIMLLGITFFAVLGLMSVFTYITPILNEVSGFAESVIPLLFVGQGTMGVIGMVVVGRYVDRYPRGCLAAGIVMVAVPWTVLGLAGSVAWVAAASFIAMGAGFSTLIASLMNRALQLSPGSTDMGLATYSTFYNTGIAGGSWLGAAVLTSAGPAVIPWLGAGSLVVAMMLLAATNAVAGDGWRPISARANPSGHTAVPE